MYFEWQRVLKPCRKILSLKYCISLPQQPYKFLAMSEYSKFAGYVRSTQRPDQGGTKVSVVWFLGSSRPSQWLQLMRRYEHSHSQMQYVLCLEVEYWPMQCTTSLDLSWLVECALEILCIDCQVVRPTPAVYCYSDFEMKARRFGRNRCPRQKRPVVSGVRGCKAEIFCK
jgi:hypothetical protein